MPKRPRVVFLRPLKPYTTAVYIHRALTEIDGAEVDLVDVPFDPAADHTGLAVPDGDIVLLVDCGVQAEIPALEKTSSPTGYYSIDSCHKFDIHREYVGKYGFDYLWVAQKHTVEWFAEAGFTARWLPLGADPSTHVYRPDMASGEGLAERLRLKSYYNVGMCGAPYPHRRRLEKLMREAGLTTNFHFRKKFGPSATRETSRCTVGLNVGAGYDGERGKDLNMRVFENMAGGQAALLTNVYDGLGYEELFTDRVHYATFRSDEEAVEKALHYSRNPEEAITVAREGQRHILENHTYLHRVREMLGAL